MDEGDGIRRRSFAICGSVIISEDNKFFNRLLFVTPKGEVAYYDKRHLHSMSGEQTVYSRGNKQVVLQLQGV